jgi:hypothetical protein
MRTFGDYVRAGALAPVERFGISSVIRFMPIASSSSVQEHA